MSDRARHELRSFGRRRTRRLTGRQEFLLQDVLPAAAIDLSDPASADSRELFPDGVREVWLEIGFGGGEHLIWQAEQNRDVGIIGCEPFIDGTVKVLGAIAEKRLTNIRLYTEDARDVLRWLPDRSLSRCFILFPDPWPKKRHNKRRLINVQSLRLLGRVLEPGAELRIGTDIGDYARTILLAVEQAAEFEWTARRPADWRTRPDDWPPTRYEQKAFREGRRSYYFSLLRK